MYYNQPFGMPQYAPFNNQTSTNVVKVHGEEGAKAYALPPNSSIILLDDGNQPIIWFKQTDGAGYPTVTGYMITPLKNIVHEALQHDYTLLADTVTDIGNRLTRLEKELGMYGKSNSGTSEPSK